MRWSGECAQLTRLRRAKWVFKRHGRKRKCSKHKKRQKLKFIKIPPPDLPKHVFSLYRFTVFIITEKELWGLPTFSWIFRVQRAAGCLPCLSQASLLSCPGCQAARSEGADSCAVRGRYALGTCIQSECQPAPSPSWSTEQNGRGQQHALIPESKPPFFASSQGLKTNVLNTSLYQRKKTKHEVTTPSTHTDKQYVL